MYCFDIIKIPSYIVGMQPTKSGSCYPYFLPCRIISNPENCTQKTDLTTVLTHTRTAIYYRFVANNCRPNVIHFSSLR